MEYKYLYPLLQIGVYMKKMVLIILCLFTCFYYIYSYKNTNLHSNEHSAKYTSMHHNISKKIIRFHVIGNSNSYVDQNIKLKIKDAIIKTYSPLFNNVNNIYCARKIALDNLDNITNTAKNILATHDISYSVKTSLSKRSFPIKQYGSTILPAGEYEAISIELGNASGRNWWCVLYPSLCVTNTSAQLSNNLPNSSFRNILTAAEYDYITYKPSTKIIYTSFFSELFF